MKIVYADDPFDSLEWLQPIGVTVLEAARIQEEEPWISNSIQTR